MRSPVASLGARKSPNGSWRDVATSAFFDPLEAGRMPLAHQLPEFPKIRTRSEPAADRRAHRLGKARRLNGERNDTAAFLELPRISS